MLSLFRRKPVTVAPSASQDEDPDIAAMILNHPDAGTRRLTVLLLGFRVAMQNYADRPSSHQAFRELQTVLLKLGITLTDHHRARCQCGGFRGGLSLDEGGHECLDL